MQDPEHNYLISMASKISIILFSSLIASFIREISASNGESNQFPIHLDYSNFYETITRHDIIVVEFYAPWCSHCIDLAPEYAKAAALLSRNEPPIILAKIDATDRKNNVLKWEFGITGYPTIKIFKNRGKSIEDYEGSRYADGIVSYLRKQVTGSKSENSDEEIVKYNGYGDDILSEMW